VLLVPGAIHIDRVDERTKRRAYVCYRTFRKRAFCVLEMFAAYLSRRKSTPTLLIRSSLAKPVYVSPLDCQKLAVGMSNFTCCEQNHATMFCSRRSARNSLERLICVKVKHLFRIGDIATARWFVCMWRWWLRGLSIDNTPLYEDSLDFKNSLIWNEKKGDDTWYDRFGRTALLYACVGNFENIVESLLKDCQVLAQNERHLYVNAEASKEAIIEIGAPGKCTALFAAMSWASPNIVSMLLKHGANPYVTDEGCRNVFMYAAFYGTFFFFPFFLIDLFFLVYIDVP
jgi:hypothetical protein